VAMRLCRSWGPELHGGKAPREGGARGATVILARLVARGPGRAGPPFNALSIRWGSAARGVQVLALGGASYEAAGRWCSIEREDIRRRRDARRGTGCRGLRATRGWSRLRTIGVCAGPTVVTGWGGWLGRLFATVEDSRRRVRRAQATRQQTDPTCSYVRLSHSSTTDDPAPRGAVFGGRRVVRSDVGILRATELLLGRGNRGGDPGDGGIRGSACSCGRGGPAAVLAWAPGRPGGNLLRKGRRDSSYVRPPFSPSRFGSSLVSLRVVHVDLPQGLHIWGRSGRHAAAKNLRHAAFDSGGGEPSIFPSPSLRPTPGSCGRRGDGFVVREPWAANLSGHVNQRRPCGSSALFPAAGCDLYLVALARIVFPTFVSSTLPAFGWSSLPGTLVVPPCCAWQYRVMSI